MHQGSVSRTEARTVQRHQRTSARRRLAAIVACAACSVPAFTAATPTVQVLTNSEGSYDLVNNGAIQFQLYTTGSQAGTVTSIIYNGQQLVGSKGLYYDIQGSPNIYLGSGETYSYRTGSNYAILTAEHPATTTEPLDVTWNWIFKDGQSGFSTYLTYNHSTAMPDYASSENRLGAEFFNPALFAYSSITDKFWGYQNDASSSQGTYVTAETIDNQGVPSEYIKNYMTKYDWRSTYQQSNGVTGIFGAPNDTNSTKPLLAADYGVWSIENPRMYEAWNSGPTHPQTPVAEGPSLIPSPSGSHFGGPGLTFTGNMNRSIGPIFTYFNEGANLTALRSDAETYTTSNPADPKDLNTFYDTLNLPYYATTAQRGTVTGDARIADGQSMTGATIILSAFDPVAYSSSPISQEYQRRAAGYNYWVLANNDGTFSIPDVRPGTYRVTIIKPGNYREGTFDNITVNAGATTNVGNLTWKPDISGQGVFQIGTFDRTAGEFRDGANYNNWIDTFNLTKEFPDGVNYSVNPANPFNDTQNWSQNWPLDQINGTLDFFNVHFTLPSAPAANSTVTVTLAIAAQEYINDFAVLVGNNRVDTGFNHTADYAPSVDRSGDSTSSELYRKLTFPGSWLVAGTNTVTFHIIGGDMQYDAVRMDIQTAGTFSQSQWNGGSGNWSDGTQWSTQQNGYTAVNKGAATINGVANAEYPFDTSTTFSDGATQTAPINNTASTLYYDATINGGTVNLDTSPQVQKLSLLSGTVNAGGTSETITANDAFVLAGGTFNGSGTINALTTTFVNFNSTISGGARINSTGAVTWNDGGTSVTVTGAGSQWNTPGLSFGQTNTSSLSVTAGGLVSTGSGLLTIGTQGTVTASSGSINTAGITNAGVFSSSGSVSVGAGAFNNSGTASITGGLSGTSVVNNSGTLILAGTNTYAGTTTVNGGLVQFASLASVGGTGASVTVNSGGAVSFVPGISTAGFLSRLNTGSTGVLALTAADSSTALNFTAAPLSSYANMGIGAVGSITYTGAYTPAGGVYRLGGGGGTLTYSPAISGLASVVIGGSGGSGTVILNSASSYTGTTAINGGVVAVSSLGNGGSASPLGQSSNAAANLIINGGTLQAGGNSSTDRLFTIGSSGGTLDGSGGSLVFTNTGTLATSGAGKRTLYLTGTNTGNSLAPAIIDPGSGSTALTMNGTGTWTLGSAANSYSGDTTVLSGTLQLGAGAALPAGPGKGNLVVGLSSTFEMNGQNLSINAIDDGPAPAAGPGPNGNGGGTVDNNSGTRTLTIGNGDASGEFSGLITGGINLVKNGIGTEILSSDNTYTGTTTLNAGAIQLGVGGTPGSFGPGDGGFRGQFGSGTIINNATLIFNRGYLTTCSNTITGTGTLKQTANAELVLGAANTYTGPTVIGEGIANLGQGGANSGTGLAFSGDCSLNASVLAVGGAASSIGSSSNAASNLVLDGGILYYTGNSATTDRLFTVTQNGGAVYSNGGLTFSNTNPIVFSGTGDRTLMLEGASTTACTFDCPIGDPSSGQTFFTKDRSGTWVLGATATLTYSGDTGMDMGELMLSRTNQIPYGSGKGNVVFTTSTDFGSIYDPILELNGFDLSINGLSGGLAGYGTVDNNVGTHTLTVGNNNATAEFAGALTGNLNVVKTGSGTQTLDGVNTNTGSTTVNAGALVFSATSVIGGAGRNVFINNGSTLGAPGTNLNQSFVSRIAGSSSGVLALTSSDTNNLDFSATGASLANVSLGAIGSVIYSGTITPYGSTYQLGGGGGTLTVTTPLTGAGDSLVIGEAGNNNGPVGTVILTTANTYGGATSVLAGVVQFNASTGIGGSGPSVTVSKGAVAAAGYAMDQPFLSRINSASLGVVALAASSGNNLDLSSVTGANLSGVSIGAVGTVTCSGIITPYGNAYAFGGGGGTLTISNSSAIFGTASLSVGLGATAPASIPNPLTLAVTAAQSYTGTTTIHSGGTITGAVNNGSSAGATGASSNAASNLILDGGTLAGTGSTDRLFTLTNNGGTLDQSAGFVFTNTGAIALPAGGSTVLTLTGSNTGHETFAPALGDPANGTTSVVKSGAGKWTYGSSNNKTYSGDTHITAGTLEALAGNAFSPNSNMNIDSGADLDFHDTSPETINALEGTGEVTNDFSGSHTDSFTIGGGNGSGTFSGSISSAGTFNLTKAGNGTQVFGGALSYYGTTAVNGGTLTLDYPSSITTGIFTVATGAALNIYGPVPTATTIASSGNTTFGASPGSGIYNRTLSSLTMASGAGTTIGPANASSNRTVLVTGTLTLAGTTNAWQSRMNLTNNDLLVHNASLAALTNQIKQGFNGGTWNGADGILSSSAATDANHLSALGCIIGGSTFDGITSSATDVLIKFTYYGDTNLDGKVDGTDYSRIDAAYLADQTNPSAYTGWFNGDFNYDGAVNGSDYTLIDNAYNTQGAQISAALAGELAVPTAQLAGAQETSAVPEPTALCLLAMTGVGLLGRWRRATVPCQLHT